MGLFVCLLYSDALTPYAYAPPWTPLNPGFYSISGGCRKQLIVLHDSPPWKVALCLPYPTTPSPFVDTVHSSRLCLKDGTIVSFFVSSLTDDIFVLKYSAYIQTSTSPPPLQWPPVLAFLSTRSCDSCEVGGWHGGIGMINDEKDGIMEKACIQTSRSPPLVTVASSPCRELPENYLCQHAGL